MIGGGFVEELELRPHHRSRRADRRPAASRVQARLSTLDGQEYGWRAGLAYEIPESSCAPRLIYGRGTHEYGATGTAGFRRPVRVHCSAAAAADRQRVDVPAGVGIGNLPQSVELSVRSGVAEGWLVFGAVKWTDWSVLQNLDRHHAASRRSIDQYQWRDGWTVTGGVVHSFSEPSPDRSSLTWDRGVSTGWDLRDDSLDARRRRPAAAPPIGGEFRGGVGFTYLAAAAETQYANAIIPGNIRSGFNQAVDSGYAITFNAGYIVQVVNACPAADRHRKDPARSRAFLHCSAAMALAAQSRSAAATRGLAASFVMFRQHSLNNQSAIGSAVGNAHFPP